jgi:hypothetical protein
LVTGVTQAFGQDALDPAPAAWDDQEVLVDPDELGSDETRREVNGLCERTLGANQAEI